MDLVRQCDCDEIMHIRFEDNKLKCIRNCFVRLSNRAFNRQVDGEIILHPERQTERHVYCANCGRKRFVRLFKEIQL